MKKYFLLLFLFVGSMPIMSQNTIINIWKNIPNSKQTDEKEISSYNDIKRISNVINPTLEVFLPSKNTISDKAVIICPGGGYSILAYDWEGTDIAKWFNSKGITAFVLKYRLPNSKSVLTSYEAPLQDAQRAIRWVRMNADMWNINPDKIGIMGFSAGGHLASTLGTQYDSKNNFNEEPLDTISAKPNFMALIYPVITMQDNYTHKGSRNNLLGKNPSEKLKNKFSNELNVNIKTPPTFLIHSSDDKAVSVENSLRFYKSLLDNNVKAEMHIYPFGGHGFGLGIGKKYLENWTDRLYEWLQNLE
jgi:acetyl esterase/lipase